LLSIITNLNGLRIVLFKQINLTVMMTMMVVYDAATLVSWVRWAARTCSVIT